MKTFEQIAQVMYKAYRAKRGDGLLEWDQLLPIHRECWIAAAKAAHKEITEVH